MEMSSTFCYMFMKFYLWNRIESQIGNIWVWILLVAFGLLCWIYFFKRESIIIINKYYYLFIRPTWTHIWKIYPRVVLPCYLVPSSRGRLLVISMTISLQASRSLVSPHSSVSVQFVMALMSSSHRARGLPLFLAPPPIPNFVSCDLTIICMVPSLTILHDNYSTDSKIWSALVN